MGRASGDMWIEFKQSEDGTTAMIFALVLLPILALIGLALDLGRMQSGKQSLKSAIDAAALAGTKELLNATRTDEEIKQIVESFLTADLASARQDVACASPNIDIDRATNTITVQVACSLETTMAGIVGVNQFAYDEEASSTATITLLDLAMVMDVSGSMAGTKLASLKDAAEEAVSTLISPETGDRVRIAIVPYAGSVNVGGSYDNVVFNPGTYHDGLDNNCSRERLGAEAVSDAPPASGQWYEYNAPNCPSAPIVPLSNNTTTLNNAINDLVANGATAGHIGLAWGWNTISPRWSSIWPTASEPLPYNDDRKIKAIILMTDGEFNTEYSTAAGDSEAQAISLCDGAKAEGVLVFSIAFQAPVSAENLMESCATQSDMFFEANSNQQLIDAYRSISSSLSELRLSY